MTDPHLPFFVYGTLLPGQSNNVLLHGRTLAWTPAELPAALLFHGPGYPFAVTDPTGAGTVRGEVVTLTEESYARTLAEIDLLEEYAPGNAANLYERVPRIVRTPAGSAAAWVYLAGARTARELLLSGTPIRNGDWRRRDDPPL